jgi:hypothetical protein
MTSTYLWIASLMFFGAWLLYWRKKRKFDRLNEHGIEEFGSYREKIKADAFDTLLLWAGCISLISGVFVLIATDYTVLGWLVFAIFAFMLIRSNRRS